MKKIKIPLDDLLTVLSAMKENGTVDIVFFTHNDLPAIADYDEMDNVITFQSVSADGKVDDDTEIIH